MAGRLRYRAIAEALATLVTPLAEAPVAPTLRAVPYRRPSGRGIAPLLDVYLPDEEVQRGSSVVLVHGGGFVVGSRGMKPVRHLATKLVRAGVAVAAIDYRMIFRGGRLGEALDDTRAALEFWQSRVGAHGLDAGRVSIAGLSAGATLAMLTAAREHGAVHRVVSAFGLYEIDHLGGPLAALLPRMLFETPDRDAWRARSPRGCTQPAAPTLLLHGTNDGLVPVEQAHGLAAHRASLGLPTELEIYEGAPHGFFNVPGEASERGAAAITRFVA